MPDDSGSIAGDNPSGRDNTQDVIDGHNNIVKALGESKQKAMIRFKTQYLNSETALNNWVKLDEVVLLTTDNFKPRGQTPLYDRARSLLNSVIYERTEALRRGQQARWGILLITDGKDNSRMATTAAVVKLWQEAEDDGTPKKGGRKAIISWAGDSRVYLLRAGKLERMTLDDTRLRDLVSPDLAKQIADKHDADRYNKQEMRKIAVVLKPKEPTDRPLIDEILRSKPWGITIPSDPEAPIEVPYSYFDFPIMTKTLAQKDLQPNVKCIDV